MKSIKPDPAKMMKDLSKSSFSDSRSFEQGESIIQKDLGNGNNTIPEALDEELHTMNVNISD